MSISTSELIAASLYAFVFGIFLGSSYDVLRILRVLLGVSVYGKRKGFQRIYGNRIKNYFKTRTNCMWSGIFIFLSDIVFSLYVTVLFIIFLFSFNHGIFRWFILVSCLLGFGAYYLTLGKAVIFFSQEIADFIKFAVNLIIWLISVPIKLLFRSFRFLWQKTFGRLYTRVKNAIDIGAKKRYTVKCTEELIKIVEFKV